MPVKSILGFIRKELLEMLPPTVFFFCVFHIVAFTRALMDDRLGIGVMTSLSATIGALILGKSILIVDALPFWRRMATLSIAPS